MISGKTYFMDANDLYWQYSSLTFNGKEVMLDINIARISFQDIPVGLDNVYRFSETPIGVLASKGFWRNESTFVMINEAVEAAAYLESELTFKDNQVIVQTNDGVGRQITIVGKQMD